MLELARPVLKRRFRDDDDVRARDRAVVFQVGEERDSLKCLAQALYAKALGVDAVRAKERRRTISSARMPFRPWWWRETIQFNPWSWYERMRPLMTADHQY